MKERIVLLFYIRKRLRIMNKILMLFILNISFGVIVLTGYSSIGLAKTNEFGGSLSYNVVFPENQKNKEVGYYDLKMKPNTEQKVILKLTNSSDKEIKVKVSLNDAKTNSNGVIDYGLSKGFINSEIENRFSTIVTGKKEVVIPKKKTINYEVKINMPKESFDGVISGGIYLEELGQNPKRQEGVKNKYVYLIGMLLSETDTIVAPELTFNNIFVDFKNAQKPISVNYSNIMPSYINDMSVTIEIKKKGTTKVLQSYQQSKMRMAPNSDINFPVPIDWNKLVSGDYQAAIKVTAENDRKWEWVKDFEITQENVERINEIDRILQEEPKGNLWLIIIGVVVCMLTLGGIYYSYKKNHNKKRKKMKRKKIK